MASVTLLAPLDTKGPGQVTLESLRSVLPGLRDLPRP